MSGWGNWVTGIEEGTGCDESWVFHAADESLSPTSETDDVLRVGQLHSNFKKEKNNNKQEEKEDTQMNL